MKSLSNNSIFYTFFMLSILKASIRTACFFRCSLQNEHKTPPGFLRKSLRSSGLKPMLPVAREERLCHSTLLMKRPLNSRAAWDTILNSRLCWPHLTDLKKQGFAQLFFHISSILLELFQVEKAQHFCKHHSYGMGQNISCDGTQQHDHLC